jgi:hypothetical protein
LPIFANKNFDFIGKAHTCFANYIHKYKQECRVRYSAMVQEK